MNKYVFDCERMKYPDTGIYHYCLQLGKHLSNLMSSEEELFYYLPPNAHSQLPNDKTVSQSSLHKFFMPDTSSYDLWHTTYQNSAYLPMRNKKIKVVLTIHDLNFMYDEHKPGYKKEKHLKHLQKNIDRADAIICISDFCKNDVINYCDTGNTPLHVIHNGTNDLCEPILSSDAYVPKEKFIFSIGVITHKKNFHALLPLLRNNDMELVIAGKTDDTEYLSFLNTRASELGVSDRMKLLGRITESDKSWYFNNCYAFASTSLAEGFCMPVAEAMSVGKPLFLANKTALPEIGGKAAFYFPGFESNEMEHTFLKGMEIYRTSEMPQFIKARSTHFCWEKSAQKYLDVYRSLL